MKKFKLIQPVDDLANLRFLSKIHTHDEYMEKSDGPYLVGHIIDKDLFRDSAQDRTSIGNEIMGLDQKLGFKDPMYRRCEFDDTYVERDKAQRSAAGWHRDLRPDPPTINPYGFISRMYMAVSNNGTLFLKESATRDYRYSSYLCSYKMRPKDLEMLELARKGGFLVTGVDYGIYLVPIRTLHSSPILPQGGPRTFLRIALP